MVKVDKVSKRYDDITALDELTVEIPKGAAYGLLGTNGAGKSTMLRLMSGVYRADSGAVTIEGSPVYDNPDVKRKLILVSDETSQFNGMTVKGMRDFYKTFYPKFSDEVFAELLKTVELPENKTLSRFSKGMKRQAAVICGIAACPDYLFLDEAFDGLDPAMRDRVRKMMINAMCDYDMTVTVSSHNLREIEEFCDTVGLLHNGKMLFSKSFEELKGEVHKIQCGFETVPEKSDFPELDIVYIEQKGGSVNIIYKGNENNACQVINKKAPRFINPVPLSLEDIFIYETEGSSYDRNALL